MLLTIQLIGQQLSKETAKELMTNIEGFELSQFLQDAHLLKPSIVVEHLIKHNSNSQCDLSFSLIGVDYQYPLSNYRLIGIKKEGIRCGEIIKMKTPNWEERYLIAIDTSQTKNKQSSIKYISGQMFCNNVSTDFELNPEAPKSYMDYIRIKLFDIDITEVEFIESKNEMLYFKVFSNLYDKEFQISIIANKGKNTIVFEE